MHKMAAFKRLRPATLLKKRLWNFVKFLTTTFLQNTSGWSSIFFSGFTFYKEALCFIIFILSLCSNMLNLENILEYIPQKWKEHAHFKISSWDEISSRQKRVNSKRHFTIDRNDFIPRRVSSRDEISRVNTL